MLRVSVPGRYALAFGFALATHAAAAAEFGSFGYPPQAVLPFGAATVTSVIAMPREGPGIHGFYMNVVLPRDYSKNGKVRIVVYLNTSVAKPCNMAFTPLQLTRWRPGVAPLNSSAGLTPADGSNFVAFPNNNAIVTKVFDLARDAAFPGGQRPGDALRIALAREGDTPGDTCNGVVHALAIDIRYPRAPAQDP